jgi:hypothetical protein
MNLNEGLQAKGELTIIHRAEDGTVKNAIHVPNLVVTTGKTYIASRIVGVAATVMSHMAIGIGSASPVAGDPSLGSESGRVALASQSSSGGTVTYTATFPAGTGTGAITEAGVFNASSSGTMLCRTTFPTVTKQSGDSIAITWVVTVS